MYAKKIAMMLALSAAWISSVPAADFDWKRSLDQLNVRWDVPGPTSCESMPLGNGDIGLNVWADSSGSLMFYIGKSDSWSEEPDSKCGLLKVGGVKITATPSDFPAQKMFSQILKLRTGEIVVEEGAPDHRTVYRVWVDANHPVIRVEVSSDEAKTITANLFYWHDKAGFVKNVSADQILKTDPGQIAWCHCDKVTNVPLVQNLTWGAVIEGKDLVNDTATTVHSAHPTKSQLISVHVLTETDSSPDKWATSMRRQVEQMRQLDFEQTRAAHTAWWDAFWQRSWIFVGNSDAKTDGPLVTRGYNLQRFISACAGRGQYPIHFNGSLFVVDWMYGRHPEKHEGVKLEPRTADFRWWGAKYWMQNTRLIYWPMLMGGDYDMLQPFFSMYTNMLQSNAPLVKDYYNHDGSYVAETSPFYGGIKDLTPMVGKGKNTDFYFYSGLECLMMMSDYYLHTHDDAFARTTLVPAFEAMFTFYEQHFGRDKQGRLLISPANALENAFEVTNPTPDVAALHVLIQRGLALPNEVVNADIRSHWAALQKILPPIPMGRYKGTTVIQSCEYPSDNPPKWHSGDNPQLYTMFPMQMYGVGLPDLKLALDSFNSRHGKGSGGWLQDIIYYALLGMPDKARECVVFNFTDRDDRLKFPAFWKERQDYPPNQCGGGNAQIALQRMLVQEAGNKIMLLPAWPSTWDAQFKLHLKQQTVITGTVKQGKLVSYDVVPAERKADVTVCQPQESH